MWWELTAAETGSFYDPLKADSRTEATWQSVMKSLSFLLCYLTVSLSDREKLKPGFQIPWRTCCRSIPICIQHSERLSQVSPSLFDLSVQCLGTPKWILTLFRKVIQPEMPVILTRHPFQRSDQMFWPELSRSQIGNHTLSNLYRKSSNIHRVSSLNVGTIIDLKIKIKLSFIQGFWNWSGTVLNRRERYIN